MGRNPMKLISSIFVATLLVTIASTCAAQQFSREDVVGNWTWTHMILEDGPEYKINETVEFQADGTYIQYDMTGGVRVRANWEISGDMLVYNDKRGEQKWKLVSFEKTKLHFDHAGAEMFFERQ